MEPSKRVQELLQRRGRSWDGHRRLLLGSAALGITVAATLGGLLWRTLSGPKDQVAAADLAALTAESVMNAAQAHVIDVVENGNAPGGELIAAASRDGVREAAAAGADVTAAAVGVVRGARAVHGVAGLGAEAAAEAARRGALEVASEIGPVAERRVSDAVGQA